MSKKGIRKVDQYFHEKSGLLIDIHLDIEESEFRAVIGSTLYRDKDIIALKGTLYETLENIYAVELKPLIEVTPNMPTRINTRNQTEFQAGVDVYIKRFWWGRDRAGHLYRMEWDIHDTPLAKNNLHQWNEYSVAKQFTTPPCHFRHYGTNLVYYFPYSQDLWQGLLGIINSIESLQGLLTRLLEAPDLIAQAGNKNLLTNGESNV